MLLTSRLLDDNSQMGETKKISKYELGEVIGRGGMGMVYKAYDPDVDRHVAIKTLHAHLISDEDERSYMARFRQEAQAAAKCVHPNIVTILELGEDDHKPFIVMEYVNGTSLDQWLQKSKRLNLKLLLKILLQVLMALDKAHKMGIVHRDIKPANIMVMDDGTVKLTDFGIARVSTSSKLTQVGYVLGTPDYMAPEQREGSAIDHRVDIFAITLIFHEFLCELNFSSLLELGSLPRINGLPSETHVDYQAKIPLVLIPVIEKGLAVSPVKRYQFAKEMSVAIKSSLAELRADGTKAPATTQPKVHREKETVVVPSDRPQVALNSDQMTVILNDTNAIRTQSGAHSGHSRSGIFSNVDETTISELKESYARFTGENAAKLITKHSADAISFAELIYSLATEISKEKDRNRFLTQWQD